MLTLQAQLGSTQDSCLDAYLAPMGWENGPEGLRRARMLRREGFAVELGDPAQKAKKHFDAAERVRARNMIFVGDTETREGSWSMKAIGSKSPVVQNFACYEDLVVALRARNAP